MATSSSSDRQRAELTIPATYLEDARAAAVREILSDGEALRTNQAALHDGRDTTAEDRDSSAVILQRSTRVLAALLGASGDVAVTAERDNQSNPLCHTLEELVRLLSERLVDVAQYGPIPMGDVLDIAAELRWAAEETIRIEPSAGDRLISKERKA